MVCPQAAFELGKFYGKSFIDRHRELHMAAQLKASQQRRRVGTLRDTLSHAKSVCYQANTAYLSNIVFYMCLGLESILFVFLYFLVRQVYLVIVHV